MYFTTDTEVSSNLRYESRSLGLAPQFRTILLLPGLSQGESWGGGGVSLGSMVNHDIRHHSLCLLMWGEIGKWVYPRNVAQFSRAYVVYIYSSYRNLAHVGLLGCWQDCTVAHEACVES